MLRKLTRCPYPVALLLMAGSLVAAPVTNDLWDSSQPGFADQSFTISQGGGVSCGGFISILGGTTNPASGCDGTVFNAFGFGDGANTTQLQWATASVTIGSFQLYSPSDFGGDEREIIQFKLFTVDASNVATEIFDSGAISHAPANDGTTPLVSATLSSPVTSTRWRAQFFGQNSTLGGPIFQIIELDGFAPVTAPPPPPPGGESNVPEPSTFLLIGTGIASVACLKRRRR